MRIRVRLFSIFFLAVLLAPLFAGSGPSSDELAVRAAYAAVVLRSQIGSVYHTYAGYHLSSAPQLAIRLSNLHAGPISEIVSTPISKLVTVPSADLLLSQTGTFSLDSHPVAEFLTDVHWGPVKGRYNFNNDYAIFAAPLSKVLETAMAGPGPAYNRYLTYSVSVSAQGRERSYQALALFREGDSTARTVDYILGEPEDLIGKNLVTELVGLPANLPVAKREKLKAFIDSLVVDGSCSEDPATKLCCDAATKQCGISSHELAARN